MYWKPILVGIITLILALGGVWYYLFRVPTQIIQTETPTTPGLGEADTRTTPVPTTTDTTGNNTTLSTTIQNGQKIFKIADGPITTATFIQTFHPTTTIARFVLAENGHIADQIIDNAGSVSRAVSNTTIPGTVRGQWGVSGSSVVLQYINSTGVIKTIYLGFPQNAGASTTSSTSTPKAAPTQIQFLPDNINDFSVSPDGKNIAYLLTTTSGSDGYLAQINGTHGKKLFSTPFTQLLVSWPALSSLLIETPSAAGVTGGIFSVSTVSGAITPLVYAPGVTAIADAAFSQVIYQKISGDVSSFVHTIKSGLEKPLSFNPIPEKCSWSKTSSALLYCGAPVQYVPPSYLDSWHQGAATAQDGLFMFNTATGRSQVLAVPGNDGGVASDVYELTLSPNDTYLMFIKKGDRSLWGVRLK
jgi:hypothetical protein